MLESYVEFYEDLTSFGANWFLTHLYTIFAIDSSP